MNNDILRALEVLRNGGLILYPTDTIWGIGCDATNTGAVAKIYDIKKRADSKSMLVLVDTENRLAQYIDKVPEIAWQLIEVADKPMTIIYPGAKNLAENLVADDGSVGIRLVKDEFCKKLIERFKKPIVSTSANISGDRPPAVFNDIPEEIKQGVDYIVEWRQDNLSHATPSSIIKIDASGRFSIIRH
ncbi:MAG: threonylcarbamoyl-AMP synthase [Bacteroidales bacterium]|nr:threonylcarbamoyl-AMP synthase [Bacteroidales bacterium]